MTPMTPNPWFGFRRRPDCTMTALTELGAGRLEAGRFACRATIHIAALDSWARPLQIAPQSTLRATSLRGGRGTIEGMSVTQQTGIWLGTKKPQRATRCFQRGCFQQIATCCFQQVSVAACSAFAAHLPEVVAHLFVGLGTI